MSFSKEEYQKRLKKVKSMMEKKGIELLISHDTNNMNYLTGYDACLVFLLCSMCNCSYKCR